MVILVFLGNVYQCQNQKNVIIVQADYKGYARLASAGSVPKPSVLCVHEVGTPNIMHGEIAIVHDLVSGARLEHWIRCY